MLKKVIVTNYLHDSITLELDRPESSGFIIESITGISPDDATINTTELATRDGGSFNSSRKNIRNIVLNLKFQETKEDLTIEEVRHKTYRYFPLKRFVTMTFVTDIWEVLIDGYVEKNEVDIFSEREGCQISILCPKPWFRGNRVQSTYSSGREAMFEFPFWNDLTYLGGGTGQIGLTDTTRPNYDILRIIDGVAVRSYNLRYSEGIVFGEIRNYVFPHEVFYEGTVETGFAMEILFIENLIEDPYGTTDNSAGYIVIKNSRYPGKKIIIDLDKIKQLLPRCTNILAGSDPDNPGGSDEEGWYLLSSRDDINFNVYTFSMSILSFSNILPSSASEFDEIRISFQIIKESYGTSELTFYLSSNNASNSIVNDVEILNFDIAGGVNIKKYVDLTYDDIVGKYLKISLDPISGSSSLVSINGFQIYGKSKSERMIGISPLSDSNNEEGLSNTVPIAQKGDVVRIVTKSGEKGIWYSKPSYLYNSDYDGSQESLMYWGKYQNGRLHSYKDDRFNVLAAINRDLEWFQVGPGYNRFEIYHTIHPEADEILEDETGLVHVECLEVVMENDVLYEGV